MHDYQATIVEQIEVVNSYKTWHGKVSICFYVALKMWRISCVRPACACWSGSFTELSDTGNESRHVCDSINIGPGGASHCVGHPLYARGTCLFTH